MKRFLFIAGVVTLCSCLQRSNFRYGELAGDIDPKQKRLITETLNAFPDNTEFSIAIIQNGSVNFIGARNGTDSVSTIVNHDKVFEIGSISKVFTSTLLAESAYNGKIALDDDIGKALDLTLKDNAKITFKQLSNHTSGLPRLPTNMNMFTVDPSNPYKSYDEQKLREYLTTELKTSQIPGTKSEYSNLGAGLLGYLLSRIEKKSYEELLQDKIFKRLKMESSASDRSKVEKNLVKGLNPAGYEVPNWDLNVLAGAGGILSTTNDLSKFALAQFDNSEEAMKLTRVETFRMSEEAGVGLGWQILRRDNHEYHWHNGGTGGYRSAMIIDCKSKNAAIILSNVSAFHNESGKIDVLARALIKTLE